MKVTKRDDQAFTLIEMIIVISIIALLAGMLMTHILGAKDSTKKKQALTMIKALSEACDRYKSDKGEFPPDQIGKRVYSSTLGLDGIKVDASYTLLDSLDGDGFNDNGTAYVNFKEQEISIIENYGTGSPPHANRKANIMDPWGNPYRYRENFSKHYRQDGKELDGVTDYAFNIADNPAETDPLTPNDTVFNRLGVDIWSAGSDGVDGTAANFEATKDNVTSWSID